MACNLNLSTVFYRNEAVENVHFKVSQEKRAAVGQSGALMFNMGAYCQKCSRPETKTPVFNVKK